MRFMSVRSLLIPSFLLLTAFPVLAASPVATFSCAPSETEVIEEQSAKAFDLVSGKEVDFLCQVSNLTKENIDIRLVGRQIHVGSKTAPSLSVADVVLSSEEKKEIPVAFPSVYAPGTYHYAFALVDLNQQPLTPEAIFTGRLGGEAMPSIESVTAGGPSYRWGDRAELTVKLKPVSGQPIPSGAYTLRAELLGVSGAPCQVLVENQSVETMETKLSFTLPSESGVCANDAMVTLRDKSGTAIAASTIALELPARNDAPLAGQSFTKAQSMMWAGVAVLAAGILGLWLILRRRQKTI